MHLLCGGVLCHAQSSRIAGASSRTGPAPTSSALEGSKKVAGSSSYFLDDTRFELVTFRMRSELSTPDITARRSTQQVRQLMTCSGIISHVSISNLRRIVQMDVCRCLPSPLLLPL